MLNLELYRVPDMLICFDILSVLNRPTTFYFM